MADPFNTEMQYPEYAAIQRKRKMADFLMQQGSSPLEGQMVSGHYVSPGLGGALAKALMIYKGGEGNQEADAQTQALSNQLKGQREQWLNQMPTAQQQQVELPGPTQTGEALTGTQVKTPTAEDYMTWALKGQQIDPQAAQMGMTSANMALTRESQAAARKDAQQARIENLNAQHQMRMDTLAAQNANAQQMAEANRQHQQAMAKLQADLRPEPLQPVLAPGSQTPVLMPRSQAVGMQPWNPAAAKTQQQMEDKQKGKESVSDIGSQLKSYYDTLKQEGGIPTTGGNPITNLGARIANTSVGQAIGSVAGTKSQQARESISQTRPLLMAAIKNATGMSSQQMNSNAELMFYMQAATDPSKGYEANMEALKRLDRLYGLGLTGQEGKQTGASGGFGAPAGGVKFLGFE